MIESVLNLGIKGADIVISQLEKIAEEKEKFSKPSNVSVETAKNLQQDPKPSIDRDQIAERFSTDQNIVQPIQDQKNEKATKDQNIIQPIQDQSKQKSDKKDSKSQGILKSILDAIKAQREALVKSSEQKQKDNKPTDKDQPTPPPKEEQKKEQKNETLDKLGQSAKGAAQGLATLSAGNALKGIANLIGAIPGLGLIAEAGDAIVTAAQAFKANVENAAKINLDTQESRSRISNIIQGEGEGFTGRVDLDLNSQRALAESLGERFGVVQKPLQDAIKELYKDKNGKDVDVNQAGALAQGQFSALGTDKGFFLQKISDQLQGLPPSMKQAMQASLLKNVTKEEQMTETSATTGSRQTNTSFNNDERRKAAEIATPLATAQALQINGLLKDIDVTLNNGFSNMITALQKAINQRSVVPLFDIGNSIGKPN